MDFDEYLKESREHYLALCPNMQEDELLRHTKADYHQHIKLSNAIKNNEVRFIEKTEHGYLYDVAGTKCTMTDVIQLAKLPDSIGE